MKNSHDPTILRSFFLFVLIESPLLAEITFCAFKCSMQLTVFIIFCFNSIKDEIETPLR